MLKVYVQVVIFDEEVFNTISPQYDTEHRFCSLWKATRQRSDRGLMFWRLTHLPTTHLHPMMQDSSHECERTRAPLSTVQRFIHAPSSITTSGPIVTFGPIRQFRPIFALGSYIVNRNMSCVEKRSKKEEHSITRHHTNTCMKVISTLSLNLYLNLSSEFFAEIMFVAIRKLTTNMSSTSKILTPAYDGIPWPYLLFEIQFPKLPFN